MENIIEITEPTFEYKLTQLNDTRENESYQCNLPPWSMNKYETQQENYRDSKGDIQ